MTVRKSRHGLAVAVVLSAMALAGCGGGEDGLTEPGRSDDGALEPPSDSAQGGSSTPSTPEDVDDPYLATAVRAVELFGSFPDAGVAILLAADAGYKVDQIVEGIDSGALHGDGSITDDSGSAVAPLDPATDAIETATGPSIAAVVLVVVREPLRRAMTPEDLRERFAEIERDVKESFGEDENVNFFVLATILRALNTGLNGEELVESVVTGRLPDHAFAAQVFKLCRDRADSTGDHESMEGCITDGPYGVQPDSVTIIALGMLDAERAKYDFAIEDLCRQAANPNLDVCVDHLGTDATSDPPEADGAEEGTLDGEAVEIDSALYDVYPVAGHLEEVGYSVIDGYLEVIAADGELTVTGTVVVEKTLFGPEVGTPICTSVQAVDVTATAPIEQEMQIRLQATATDPFDVKAYTEQCKPKNWKDNAMMHQQWMLDNGPATVYATVEDGTLVGSVNNGISASNLERAN